MDLEESAANFARFTAHCDNLIQVHHAHGKNKRGFRTKEPSLNRAVVVMAVAGLGSRFRPGNHRHVPAIRRQSAVSWNLRTAHGASS